MTIRYRQLSEDEDYVFGRGSDEFLVDSPEAILQAIETRLRLLEGEWFLDTTEGTPWLTKVLGENTKPLYDQAIKDRILNTVGVRGIDTYSSYLDPETRGLKIVAAASCIPLPTVAPRTGFVVGGADRLDINFILNFSTLG